MAAVDPFERAAEREEKEELKREIRRATLLKRVGARSEKQALAVLGIPYVIWALIRAAYFDFGSPTLPRSLVRFFFNDYWVFSGYTILVLILIWVSAIKRYEDEVD